MTVLVCGGAGFIGSAFCRIAPPEVKVVVLDALTYAGNRANLEGATLVGFVHGEIQDRELVERTCREYGVTHIVNFAAETHNDRSILSADHFIGTNVVGVYALLEVVRKLELAKFVQVSTDEVYGSITEGEFTESSPLEPNTPYSASKAAGDLQCRAHWVTYRTPVCVTRGGNTYGPYQYPEKLIPFFVTRLIQGKKVPLYGVGDQVREWIHVEDHARGVWTVLQQGEPGRVYNIGDVNERSNRWITDVLLAETGRDETFVRPIPDPRRGAHDARYSMTCEPLHALGWRPERPFEASLRETVRWFKENEAWWQAIVAQPDYQTFISRFYGPGLGQDL